ncbi:MULTISPECIES: NAD(P)H-binding protein [unclassified Novosphingobium]|uniref:NmrA family NAD(P)-binding protein n=1 Tax=unclassified Novosphingobium TaxID=2644732 RepID=UPI00146DC2AF|nr:MULTISPECIES: NAD(P)H-binding protein [unclassified Novosphingobium]NMN06588.1 nucleoside-diphosphate-sugar epimerase [Novosphingobium sp. SG919]NMN88962.1 nucleoside-diphosphate-sugar epimerase [Novosphingobium sp. SG916]
MTKTILILGATGGIGGAVARTMLARGWAVRALVRDTGRAAAQWGEGAAPQWLEGDALRADDVMAAAQGAAALLHGVNPPGYRNWETLVLPMLDASLAAARRHGARLLLPGTIYNYDAAATPVIDAATPQHPRGRKGAIRVEMERRLAAAAPEVSSIVLRAGDFFGPGAAQSWFSQALAQPPYRVITQPGRAGIGHTWAYLPDLAETFARLLELPEGKLAAAERLQFGGFWDHDGRQMAQHVRAALAQPDLAERAFPWWLMRMAAPLGGFPRDVAEVAQFWRHPVRLDNARLVALLGKEPATPIAQAIGASLSAPA